MLEDFQDYIKDNTEISEAKPGYEEYIGDDSLKRAYYDAADGIYGLQDSLNDGNYKNILAEFNKVVKAFQAFDKKVGFGKNL